MPKNSTEPTKKTGSPAPQPAEYRLMLFVTGATPNSIRAVANVKRICSEHLPGRYSLEIIDVYRHREMAAQYQLVALPLLIKKEPAPEKRMIGDFSDEQKLLSILNLI